MKASEVRPGREYALAPQFGGRCKPGDLALWRGTMAEIPLRRNSSGILLPFYKDGGLDVRWVYAREVVCLWSQHMTQKRARELAAEVERKFRDERRTVVDEALVMLLVGPLKGSDESRLMKICKVDSIESEIRMTFEEFVKYVSAAAMWGNRQ